jgi:hypothetical protein
MIKLNKTIFNNSINELKLSEDIELTDKYLVALYMHSIDFLKSNSKLPCNPAPEKHPYKEILLLDNSFQKFIIGTFPPHKYQADVFDRLTYCSGKKVSKPKIPFYHGNREMLWKYLLGEELFNSLDTDRSKRKIQIIEFLKKNKINYADIIDYCQRKEYNSNDSDLYNILLNNDLVKSLSSNNNDGILLVFNTGSFFTLNGMNFRVRKKAFNPKSYVFDMFVYLLIENGSKVEVQIKNEERISIEFANRDKLIKINNILSFNLFIDNKKFSVIAGPTPTTHDGKLKENLIFKRFIKKHCPNKSLGFQKKEFKRFVYQTALLGDHKELEFLNFD